MAEFFTNKYVVKVESGHPGYVQYEIISTREGMAEMVQALTAALDAPPHTLRPAGLPASSPTPLWNEYATVAGGKTSRVYLSFAVAGDLSPYHVRPSRLKGVLSFLGCLLIPVVLGFAGVGLLSTLQSFFG